jgi:alpha-L-fucosidase
MKSASLHILLPFARPAIIRPSATRPAAALLAAALFAAFAAAAATASAAAAAAPASAARPAGDARVKAEHEDIGVSEKADDAARTRHPGAQWFPDAALGLFIHWGTSSVRAANLSNDMVVGRPLGGKRIADPGERARIIREKDYNLDGKGPRVVPLDYWTMAKDFNPRAYDPDKWLAAAREAGFTYAVLTTKHHEGFALWPSDAGDFNTKNWMGGRDLVKPFVEACRRHGLKAGLYFSGPDWWFDRDYKNFLHASALRKNPEFPELGPDLEPRKTRPSAEARAAHQEAYRRLVRAQIEELLTRYGKIDLLWFDGKPDIPDGANVISKERIRELQPGIVINPRMHGTGDFVTFERFRNFPATRPAGWAEFCDTGWTGSWAYVKMSHRAPAFVLGWLPRCRAWGMNYLLNVGPTRDGELTPAIYENMAVLARWMKANGESIKGAGPLPGGETASVPATAAGDARYLFAIPAFKTPAGTSRADQLPPRDETLTLAGAPRPEEVALLGSGRGLDFDFAAGVLRVKLPAAARTDLVDVVRVKLPAAAASPASGK